MRLPVGLAVCSDRLAVGLDLLWLVCQLALHQVFQAEAQTVHVVGQRAGEIVCLLLVPTLQPVDELLRKEFRSRSASPIFELLSGWAAAQAVYSSWRV